LVGGLGLLEGGFAGGGDRLDGPIGLEYFGGGWWGYGLGPVKWVISLFALIGRCQHTTRGETHRFGIHGSLSACHVTTKPPSKQN